jgi:conjugative relaxase-like TrwC/TraI family protein
VGHPCLRFAKEEVLPVTVLSMGGPVLTIHRLTADRASYYLSDLGRELPPPRSQLVRGGEWAGAAAARLGLHGAVDPARFDYLLQGRHPETGHQLGATRVKVLAYDLTFSAPKSTSVVFGLGGEEAAHQILEGHAEAVNGALDYFDAHAVTAVRRHHGEAAVLATSGLVAGAFTHGVNRNIDPHLHTHVVMANLVHGEDGRWSALDQRAIWAHQRAGAAVYEAHLRAELTGRLGLRWTQAPFVTAEIQGVSPLLLGEFSTRAADIRRHGFEHGVRSTRGHRIAAAATRADKGEGTAFCELVPQWRQRAAVALGGPPDLSQWRHDRPLASPTLSEHQFAGVLSVAPDGRAHRRDVVSAFAHAARDGATASSLSQLTELWLPEAGTRPGIAEGSYPGSAVVPGPHLLRALGSRPIDVPQHAVWLEGARSINAYRARWRVTGPETLGASHCQPGWSTDRMVDHLRTADFMESARARLGRREPMTIELGRGR